MLFWVISRPLVATPPALAALAGPKSTPARWKAAIASGVEGMFAPSATAFTPFLISVSALSPSSSFWVAQGRAMSQGTVQMPLQPGVNFAEGTRSAYAEMRPRSTSLIRFMTARSTPFSSTT